ncbi:hypothetical protein A374_04279 [Fictibacillus macauensis ZFHKF-1]|uniref:Ethanolamine utilization protein n=1 Tax=Fictibacillus macauensis ZFHKF-1 TaxID=1196324 RepID=I8UIN7_9BACL|nr:hypothetical protein [Fictibacillus macauensis]EIT86760.1 hypothetical protein A374_04279 [Fictibacillus macauensis ZFHKF-1]
MTTSVDATLIATIVQEVLQQLSALPVKPHLYVWGEVEDEGSMNKLTQAIGQRYELTVLSSLQKDLDVKKESDIIFLNCDQDLIVRGALGLTDTAKSKALAEALHQGLQPTLFLSYEDSFKFNGNSAYKAYLHNQKSRLEAFGVSCTTMEQWLHEQQETKVSSSTAVYDAPLLTERAVEAFTEQTLLLAPGTIVTPLARDAARRKEITLSRT